MGSVGRCALLQWRLIYSSLRAFVGVPCTALVALCQGRVASVFNASPNNQAQQQSCQQCNLKFSHTDAGMHGTFQHSGAHNPAVVQAPRF